MLARKNRYVLAAAVATVVAVGTTIVALRSGADPEPVALAPTTSVTTTTLVEVTTTTTTPPSSSIPTTTTTTTTTTPKSKAVNTPPKPPPPPAAPAKPAQQVAAPALPPAPTPPPATGPGPCVPRHDSDASRADVQAALAASAAKRFPLLLRGGAGTAQLQALPRNLIEAVAWQESGWKSSIIACDGGIGTMQVMPATASWLNQRFGFDPVRDATVLQDNTDLGAAYLEYLVYYFGHAAVNDDFTLIGPDGKATGLLRAVVASYNAGAGNVELGGDGTSAGAVATIPKSVEPYVANVIALMSSKPWTK
ncbi:MAG TPA: lytic transglycosylase domain-containing protein [Actinokineospora sp.]|nr:lytic transglycosylase domain-containing protein [Actinokineospora sp.]